MLVVEGAVVAIRLLALVPVAFTLHRTLQLAVLHVIMAEVVVVVMMMMMITLLRHPQAAPLLQGHQTFL
jgi:hypothetical protein